MNTNNETKQKANSSKFPLKRWLGTRLIEGRAWIEELEKMEYGIFDFDPKIEGVIYMLRSGVTDYKNKMIYEGDCFHIGDPNIVHVVVWHDSGLMGKQIGNRSFVGLEHWQNEIEIIGNAFEDPELLECT